MTAFREQYIDQVPNLQLSPCQSHPVALGRERTSLGMNEQETLCSGRLTGTGHTRLTLGEVGKWGQRGLAKQEAWEWRSHSTHPQDSRGRLFPQEKGLALLLLP